MARFRLTEKHYLYVQAPWMGQLASTEWEHKETIEGREHRKRFTVPRFLDPTDSGDWNSPEGIVLATKASNQYSKDYIFDGKLTPDMVPLDDEAEALMEDYKKKWIHPIESLQTQGFSQTLLQDFERQLATALAKAEPVSLKGVTQDQFRALQEQITQLATQNVELQAKLAEAPQSRRV